MAEQRFFVNINNPKSLYELALISLVSNIDERNPSKQRIDRFRVLPNHVLFDVYATMSTCPKLTIMLLEELGNLDVFTRFLRYSPERITFQYINDVILKYKEILPCLLRDAYVARYGAQSAEQTLVMPNDKSELAVRESSCMPKFVDAGLRLGKFLSKRDCLPEGISVLACLNERLKQMQPFRNILATRIDCLQCLLYAETAYCNFVQAQKYADELQELTTPLIADAEQSTLLAISYTQISCMYFALIQYKKSKFWSKLALQYLKLGAPKCIAIEVLRQAAKSFKANNEYIRSNNGQSYKNELLDSSFMSLSTGDSASIIRKVFGYSYCIYQSRYELAMEHKELANDCVRIDVTSAMRNIARAQQLMKTLVPSDNWMLVSTEIVKALVLERFALRANNADSKAILLRHSEQLHILALQVALNHFGENSMLTAKQYEHLAWLYDIMNRDEEAERYYQQTIQIKTDLLGLYDYEVAITMKSLAALYIKTKKYLQAEEIYNRSIHIFTNVLETSNP